MRCTGTESGREEVLHGALFPWGPVGAAGMESSNPAMAAAGQAVDAYATAGPPPSPPLTMEHTGLPTPGGLFRRKGDQRKHPFLAVRRGTASQCDPVLRSDV